MKVSELKELLDSFPPEDLEGNVMIVEYGYRSSNQSNVEAAAFMADDRESDDWNNPQNKLGGENLYILLGGTAGNRYPPSGLRDELGV